MPDGPEAVALAFAAAINAADVEAALELWAGDAVFVSAGSRPIQGKAAIRGVLTTLVENQTKLAFEASVTFIGGEAAIRAGRLKLSGRAPAASG
jgi:ketosteroid isomerase-like protein